MKSRPLSPEETSSRWLTSDINYTLGACRTPRDKDMIDTIVVAPNQTLNEAYEAVFNHEDSGNWVFAKNTIAQSFTGGEKLNISGHQKLDGLHARISRDRKLLRFEGTLPPLLKDPLGNPRGNGEQIKTPEELERAKLALQLEVRFFLPEVSQAELPVSRLDLALNLHLNPREVLAVHRHARHPLIRRETQEYYNEQPLSKDCKPVPPSRRPHSLNSLNTLRFHGVRTTILMYDKVREIRSKSGEAPPDDENIYCIRVEIQIRGCKHIAKCLGREGLDFVSLANLSFEDCYRAYRRILCEFDPPGSVPEFKVNTENLLALLCNHPAMWEQLGGCEPLDWWRVTKGASDKHFRAMRNRVGRAQLTLRQFRWEHVLPEDRLPDLVDVMPDGRQIFIPSPFHFES